MVTYTWDLTQIRAVDNKVTTLLDVQVSMVMVD